MSDAKRSGKLPRFRDIDYNFIRRVGEAFSEGAENYEKDLPVWEKNWRKGDDKFFFDAIDHAINHLLLFKERMMLSFGQDSLVDLREVTKEDHLGHCGANLVMLSYWQDKVDRERQRAAIEALEEFKRLKQEEEELKAQNQAPDIPNPMKTGITETGTKLLRSLGINL